MAKDNRRIVHGIRTMVAREGRRLPQSQTFSAGMEDELASNFSQKELNTMKERGDIEGDWKAIKKVESSK